VQREQRGRCGVIATALVRKLGLSIPVVTVLAKLAENITRKKVFGLSGKWFVMILCVFPFFLDTQARSPVYILTLSES